MAYFQINNAMMRIGLVIELKSVLKSKHSDYNPIGKGDNF